MKRGLTWLMLGLLAVALAACARPEPRRVIASAVAPEWCGAGTTLRSEIGRGDLLIGVGQVQGIATPELARAQADARARAELSRLVGKLIEHLLDRYAASVKPADEARLALAQALTKLQSPSARIEDRFADDRLETWYAEAVLPLSSLREQIKALPDVAESFKVFLAAESDASLRDALKASAP